MKINQSADELIITKGAWTARIVGLIMLASLVFVPTILNTDTSSQNTSSPKVGAAIVGIIAIVGVVIFFLSQSTRIVLRRANQSEITKKRLLGSAHTDVFDTRNVKAVAHSVTTSYHTNANNGTSKNRTGTVSLLMHDGAAVELFSGSGKFNGMINGISLSSIIKAPLLKEAEAVSTFLAVPLSKEGEMTASEAMREIGSMFKGGSPNQPDQPSNPTTFANNPTPASAQQNTPPQPQSVSPKEPPQPPAPVQ